MIDHAEYIRLLSLPDREQVHALAEHISTMRAAAEDLSRSLEHAERLVRDRLWRLDHPDQPAPSTGAIKPPF